MAKSLNITIVQGAFLPVPALLGGAVEKVWYALGQEFSRQGHSVVHISRRHEKLPTRNHDQGVEHRRVNGYATPRSLWRLKLLDLAYSLRARSVLPAADVLVTNTFWLPVLAHRPSRGRTYVHVARYPKGQLRLYPKRSILQTVSEPIREAILREVPGAADRVRVLPYPLSPVYLVPRSPTGQVMLYTGRLHPEKGVHLLIEAFGRNRASGLADWKLRIIGPWRTAQGGAGETYRHQLLDLAQRAGGTVEIVEPIFDETRLVAEYRNAAIFVYPSLAEFGETFGLSVLEAMAAGCAPLVSSLGCFQDFVQHGKNGIVFNHRAPDAVGELAMAMRQLADHEAERESIRDAAWCTARDYALPEIAARMITDFRSIVEPRSRLGS